MRFPHFPSMGSDDPPPPLLGDENVKILKIRGPSTNLFRGPIGAHRAP